ncbi:type II toxin-antitoxin system HicA family toxin [Pinisolibacter sp.]|uniref:type II toxin-antitoxin system HicA family toxin n=1 Tax=Pinisolibacter sp. TaxID=2172024 RepID=UPI002FDDE723
MTDFYPDLIRLLLDGGCEKVRQGRGDHEIWRSPKSARPFTVDRSVKSRHTANAVLKQAGLPKAF